MSYRGYLGSVKYGNGDRVFHCETEFLHDVVTFEGTDVDSLEAAFHEVVADYLELCEAEGRNPEQPFKGSFNVRTGPETHRKAVLYARAHGMNLNTVMVKALKKFLPA